MTQEEILQYNKRCAEFLGEEMTTYFVETQMDLIGSSELHFHSDWNWIHEVCEFINKTQNPKQGGDTTHSTLKREVQTLLSKSAKEAVVQAINEFLIWYEQNKIV